MSLLVPEETTFIQVFQTLQVREDRGGISRPVGGRTAKLLQVLDV